VLLEKVLTSLIKLIQFIFHHTKGGKQASTVTDGVAPDGNPRGVAVVVATQVVVEEPSVVDWQVPDSCLQLFFV
jgi:hypothetical protein